MNRLEKILAPPKKVKQWVVLINKADPTLVVTGVVMETCDGECKVAVYTPAGYYFIASANYWEMV